MTTPLILFPDVELWLANYLRAVFVDRVEPYTTGVYVSNTVPSTRRPRMVVVRRDGGPRLDVIREVARVGVNVWAETEQDATDLARITAALIWASPDGNPVLRVRQTTGPTPITDVSGKPIRYMTYEITLRGTEI